MKRLLIFFALLGALLLPQAALAAPYAFGPDALNDASNLESNILNLIGSNGSGGAGLGANPQSLDPDTVYNFTLFAYSNFVENKGGLSVYNGHVIINNAHSFYHIGEYLAGEVAVEYVDGRFSKLKQVVLSDLGAGVVLESGSINFDLLGDPVPYSFGAGTIFVGFNIPGSSAVGPDFIIAASPLSAVPVPAAVWLLGSGLGGLSVLRRKLR